MYLWNKSVQLQTANALLCFMLSGSNMATQCGDDPVTETFFVSARTAVTAARPHGCYWTAILHWHNHIDCIYIKHLQAAEQEPTWANLTPLNKASRSGKLQLVTTEPPPFGSFMSILARSIKFHQRSSQISSCSPLSSSTTFSSFHRSLHLAPNLPPLRSASLSSSSAPSPVPLLTISTPPAVPPFPLHLPFAVPLLFHFAPPAPPSAPYLTSTVTVLLPYRAASPASPAATPPPPSPSVSAPLLFHSTDVKR